jgi:hypothetical protein
MILFVRSCLYDPPACTGESLSETSARADKGEFSFVAQRDGGLIVRLFTGGDGKKSKTFGAKRLKASEQTGAKFVSEITAGRLRHLHMSRDADYIFGCPLDDEHHGCPGTWVGIVD